MKVYWITKDGKSWDNSINIKEAVDIADRTQSQVFIWNDDMTAIDLIYSYGEKAILAKIK